MPKLCIALDVDYPKATELIESLSGYGLVFKIGPKLLLESGGDVLRKVKDSHGELFLDLKLHDIPNTVGLAVSEAERQGIDYLTLHTLGGKDMLERAVDSADGIKLLGVTLLTSHDREYLSFIRTSFGGIKDMVLYLSELARSVGLFGVVCSGWEVKDIKERTGFFTVVPGIRLSSSRQDQKRVYTPEEAVRDGADMLVMGRDIYNSPDPVKVVEEVLERIS